MSVQEIGTGIRIRRSAGIGSVKALRSAEDYARRIEEARGLRRLYQRLETRAVVRALAHAERGSVLDVPCGTGRLHALLRERFDEVVGVDLSEAMLRVYRRGGRDRVGRCADAFDLPWADTSFDWAVSHRLMHHLRTDELRLGLLRSLARVVRRGIVLYAWVETPLRRGRRCPRAIAFAHLHSLLVAAGFELEARYFAAWPFQPKVELVARKRHAPAAAGSGGLPRAS